MFNRDDWMITQDWTKMAKFDLPEDTSYFRTVPAVAIQHGIMDTDVQNNAIWGLAVSPTGRVFFSVCAELTQPTSVRLYEYIPADNSFKFCFRLEEHVVVQNQQVRASKIHTSMAFMEDGRLIMATHTTAKAPQHPTWMVDGYYHHLWEGYPGSNILIYDPETGLVENRGVPVPHETVYGGAYDCKHQNYYFIGMIRGHLYKLHVPTNAVTDMGQVTEFGTYRLLVGPDGHIYSSSRVGRLFRINVDTEQIEELGITFPFSSYSGTTTRNELNSGGIGPDGRLYMQVVWGDSLFAYNCETNELENLGSFMPDSFKWTERTQMIGVHFDKYGVLWYGLMTCGCRLCSWDVLHGGKPVDHGFLGTKRVLYTLAEVEGDGEYIYFSDGNHFEDPNGIIRVDLEALREAEANGVKGEFAHDVPPYVMFRGGRDLYPYDDWDEICERIYPPYFNHWGFYNKNSESMVAPNAHIVRIWEHIDFNLPVRSLRWDEDGVLRGVCGKEQPIGFDIVDQQLTAHYPLECFPPEQEIDLPEDTKLPAMPGRQYQTDPTASVQMADGSLMVGTKTGMLCRIKDGKTYSLGTACFNGPIHQMTTDAKGERVFGVAGHEMDMGMVFEYDHENGLRWRGRCYTHSRVYPYMSLSSQPICCALSPDGQWLAIGVADRMSCVYLYEVGKENVEPGSVPTSHT